MMFFFRNREVDFPYQSLLSTDMHSHILPGIDDGAKTVEDSISLIKSLNSIGYKKFIVTPHTMNDMYKNTKETISAAYQTLREELIKRDMEVPLSFASEYLIDEGLPEKIEQGLLSFGGANQFVLVETMFSVCPPNIEQILFQLDLKGYRPILAHPERYHFMDRTFAALDPFIKYDCLFQPNLLSFAGYYGEHEQKMAYRLLDAGFVNFLGTDIHHLRHFRALKHLRMKTKELSKLEARLLMNREIEVNSPIIYQPQTA